MTSTNMSLEDVLDALMLEEPRPTYEALLRWSERYPRYRDDLARFFATWSAQALWAEQSKQIVVDEERLAARTGKYALEIARRQGRVVPAGPIASLGPFDQLVVTAIYLLHGEGYSVNIAGKVDEISGTRPLLGSVFVSLSRLENRGLVSPRFADPATEPEGKTRRYFTATLAGERALAAAKETSKLLA